jgi:uncharacterized HAD superfamily protein
VDTIGFDIDGVLYDIHRVTYTELRARHNLNVSLVEFWCEDGYKNNYTEKFWENFYKIPILYEKTPPNKDIIDTVNYLSNKYNICYITSRPDEVRFVTGWWLKSYKFPNYDNVFFSNNKTIDIRKNKCIYFIEDQWIQDKIDKMNKITNVVLVDRVYNRHIEGVPRIQRLSELKNLL